MIVQGMLGLGDNIHQRAVIKQLMEKQHITLATPWPQVYHDLVGDRLSLTPVDTRLRTQAKNVARSKSLYDGRAHVSGHRIWYSHQQIRQCGGFLAAMCDNSRIPIGDFSMTAKSAWVEKARSMVPSAGKPILVYRPLVSRKEWMGCAQRNPDAVAYTGILQSIRDEYFVVSIADVQAGVEWIESPDIHADLELHHGELDTETLIGMTAIADMVFCAPGFMLVMAQALRKRMIAVFGGHESARLYAHGYAENLFIEPVSPCECFDKYHKCDKRIDIQDAVNKTVDFMNDSHVLEAI